MMRPKFSRYLLGIAAASLLAGTPAAAGVRPQIAAQPAPATEFRLMTSPVIQWMTPESFEVFLMTSHPAACSLEIRKRGSGEEFRAAAGRRHGLIDAGETFHRIAVSGLEPGGAYEYRAVARQIQNFEPYKIDFGVRIETGVHPIDIPVVEEPEIRFAVLNDIHKNTPLIRGLMERIEAENPQPHFVFLNGDILSHIEGEGDIPAVLDLPGRYASEHPLVWIRGNHECRGKFARHLTRYLSMPDGRYYTAFRRGPVQFLVLDGGEDKADADPAYSGLVDFDSYRAEEEAWFRGVIESAGWKSAPFRVLVCHIPIGRVPGDEEADPVFLLPYRQRWAEIMNGAGLDLEIAGHYHEFRLEEPAAGRSYPIVIGGGPRKESAVIISVRAAGDALGVRVTNIEGVKLGERVWKRPAAS